MSPLEIVGSLAGIVVASLLSFFGAVMVANRSSKATVDENLWNRASEELKKMGRRIDDMQLEIDALEAKLEEQETAHKAEIETLTDRIKELERLLEEEKARRIKVERENEALRRENGQLRKTRSGRKGMS